MRNPHLFSLCYSRYAQVDSVSVAVDGELDAAWPGWRQDDESQALPGSVQHAAGLVEFLEDELQLSGWRRRGQRGQILDQANALEKAKVSELRGKFYHRYTVVSL